MPKGVYERTPEHNRRISAGKKREWAERTAEERAQTSTTRDKISKAMRAYWSGRKFTENPD
jgi:hypothetical protein